ncbi:uncharacterized protein KY384_002453 [Bacidia gigantensis]|uniref:uncharacterized protein n=1 Tax=Bacidia gigantensis TaxID=2732470 RepID=UPI001D03F16B|nr:uncharacterized protein KY384_002453 [Bacidia gigantensis]KAG8532576.1 hypothetical protein KY384_002453 [Bacidia gigantensis]
MYHNPTARTFRSTSSIAPAVLDFHKTLPSYAATPLLRLPNTFSTSLGLSSVFLKDESNRFGLPAFKILGAPWACYRTIIKKLALSPTASLQDIAAAARGREIRFHAATDGNFGRAVARMAGTVGVESRIYVPRIMVEETKRLIGSEGAEVVVAGGDYNDAVKTAAQGAEEDNGRLGLLVQDDAWEGYEEVPQWVVDGYSSMMLEIDEQMHDAVEKSPDMVVVPVGVGSLAQAVVVHFKSKDQSPMVVTVEPDTAACLKTSLEAGHRVTIETGDTNMCGMNCGSVSFLAWPYLRDGVDASVTVTDEESSRALQTLRDMGISTGPCSAGTLAALLKVCERDSSTLGLTAASNVVILGTEGPR